MYVSIPLVSYILISKGHRLLGNLDFDINTLKAQEEFVLVIHIRCAGCEGLRYIALLKECLDAERIDTSTSKSVDRVFYSVPIETLEGTTRKRFGSGTVSVQAPAVGSALRPLSEFEV